ncbi:hydroxyproline-rich glycoprotein [Stagonosporopsis vannaccii]|nr:hydroxyproline-rich glycoprotein [Stagonosporopsis vannaccii]
MSDEDDLLVIARNGDLILDVSQEESSRQYSYRVDSETLQRNSRYFENLLSERFSEGQKLAAALKELNLAGHATPEDAPLQVLPRISIVNAGRIAISKASSIRNLVADFLRAIHGLDLAVPNPPVANIANLAVVADRFDAVDCVARYVQRKKFLHLTEAKSKGRASPALTEERVRQKLLIGLLLDHPPWVTRYTRHLIIRDSAQWRPDAEEDHTKALWWDIPNGLEDEMIQRREYILETINSLQAHFLRLYTSGDRQCKLGYDTSLQCDSFQLGEMIRFFTKIDTLRMQGKIYDNAEPTFYQGDIERLLSTLRQTSSYQIDSNHAHCGLRVRLMPLLDMLQDQLSLSSGNADIGVCGDCWVSNRSEYAWSLVKRPVLWTIPRHLPTSRTVGTNGAAKRQQNMPGGCLGRHLVARDMFMAVEKSWTDANASGPALGWSNMSLNLDPRITGRR